MPKKVSQSLAINFEVYMTYFTNGGDLFFEFKASGKSYCSQKPEAIALFPSPLTFLKTPEQVKLFSLSIIEKLPNLIYLNILHCSQVKSSDLLRSWFSILRAKEADYFPNLCIKNLKFLAISPKPPKAI